MKKAFCFIIIAATLFLVSCSGNTTTVTTLTNATEPPSFTNSDATITETNSTTTTETLTIETSATDSTVSAEVFVPTGHPKYSMVRKNHDVETSVNVIFFFIADQTDPYNLKTCFYDKASGKICIFCADPDCEHIFYTDRSTWSFVLDCPAAMMGKMTSILNDYTVASTYVNGRVYFVCLAGMYSCTENGDDLREEFKLSENENFAKERDKFFNGYYPIISVFSDGKSIFFCHVDSKKNITQYRYDTSMRELRDLTDEIKKAEQALGNTVYVDSAGGEKIFLAVYSDVTAPPALSTDNVYNTGTLVGYYATDYDFSSFEEVKDYIAAPDFVTSDGVIGKLGNDYVMRKYSGAKDVIIENVNDVLSNGFSALYLNDKYLYYVKEENLVIGKKENASGFKRDMVNVSGGKVYRYEFETGNIVCVFDEYRYDSFRAVYIDEQNGVCFLAVEKYVELGEKFFDKKSVQVLVRCEIDENGMFTVKEEKGSK